MKNNKTSYLLFAIVLILAINSPLFAQTNNNQADNEIKRFEVSGQVSGLLVNRQDASDEVFRQFGFPENAVNERFLDIGVGGRFSYNINRNLAVESEVNYFPSRPTADDLGLAGLPIIGPLSGGKKTQFLVGVKYGVRRSKYGVFGKVRPGAINFTGYRRLVGLFVIPSPTGGRPDDVIVLTQEAKATFFNIDVGGVFEYYPSRNTVFRVDVGDTIIRYNAQPPKDINPTFTRHNLQTSVGFGFRF